MYYLVTVLFVSVGNLFYFSVPVLVKPVGLALGPQLLGRRRGGGKAVGGAIGGRGGGGLHDGPLHPGNLCFPIKFWYFFSGK